VQMNDNFLCFCQFATELRVVYYVQPVSCQELKMPNCDEELRWTALPKLCQKCFGVKRKLVRTENITSKLRCDSVSETLPVPKVKHLNANSECRDEKDCPFSRASSEVSLTLTDNMLVSAEMSGSDNTICSSAQKTDAVSASSSFSNTNQNSSCTLLSTKQLNIGSKNDSKTPQTGFVRPLFKNSVSEFDAQLKETDSCRLHVNNVKVTAPGNKNKSSDLHRCPLCDMVFDVRYVISSLWFFCIIYSTIPSVL